MNLLKTVFTVSGLTLISRVLGLIRDMLISRYFGVSAATDAFWTAFKIPNLLRRTFAEGAFSQAFVPILAEYRKTRDEAEVMTLLNHVTGLLAVAVGFVTLLGILAAPWVVYLTASGFTADREKFDLTVHILRWLFPYILLISLTSLAGSILNAFNKFSVSAFAPTLLNIGMIIGTAFIAPWFAQPIYGLVAGVLIGGILQLGYHIPYLIQIKKLPQPRLSLKDPAVKRILLLMGPAIFAVSISQISMLLSTLYASYLPNGSVTWLFNADRLMELPNGLLGVALGTVLLPALSRHAAVDDQHAYSSLLDWGLRLIFLLGVPASLGLALLATPLVASLFLGGKYTPHDVLMTEPALMAYGIGLLGMLLVKVLAPAFYARQDIKTPVRIGIITLVCIQLLSVTLLFGFHFHHEGLALATGLGACLNAALMFIVLYRRRYFQLQAGWWKFLAKLLIAAIGMSAALWWAKGESSWWFHHSTLARFSRLFGCIAAGSTLYFILLGLLGFRLKDFSRREV